MQQNINHLDARSASAIKLKGYAELLKARLSFLVAFSSGFGYALAAKDQLNFGTLALFMLAGFLVSGGSVTINQVLEKDFDALMKRTRSRPIPTNRISKTEASIYSILLIAAGMFILMLVSNPLTVWLSLLSVILYSFVYTPLKRVGPIAVFVGAIPGALPPLLGWVAYTGAIGQEALILFGIQFIWQFPHFWAIAWVADEDYKRAGFKLLPARGERDFTTAVQIMSYTLFLLPLGLLPAKIGLTGINSAIVVTLCGVLFLGQTFRLMANPTDKKALQIMFGSFIYLPVVQISFLLDMI